MVKKLLLDRQSQATKQTVDGKKRLSKSILVNWLLRIFICAYAAINGKDYMLGRDALHNASILCNVAKSIATRPIITSDYITNRVAAHRVLTVGLTSCFASHTSMTSSHHANDQRNTFATCNPSYPNTVATHVACTP
jgi:hypothetical protein